MNNKQFARASFAAFAALGMAGAAHAQSAASSSPSTPFSLADTHFYLGAGLGHTTASANVGDYADLRGGALTSVGTDDSTAWKVYGGLQFTPVWGMELGYAGLGKYGVNYALPSTGGTGVGTDKLSAWSLGGTATWPINEHFSVHGLLGLAYVNSDFNFAGNGTSYPGAYSASAHSVNPTLGLGASYYFTPHLGVRFDYQNFGKVGQQTNNLTNPGTTGEARPALTSVGMEYKF